MGIANDLDRSLNLGVLSVRSVTRFAFLLARQSSARSSATRLALVVLLILTSLISMVTQLSADAWLDRVERNLRRIESVYKYAEPAGVGSKRATEVHRACIHKNDQDACAKLIWRRPDLLPIRDWAVGTAHIKRGEMREQSGNVAGALEDYRDAMGYHQFSNLAARIKRLELRQKRDTEAAAKAQAEREAKNAGEEKTIANAPSASPTPTLAASSSSAPEAELALPSKQTPLPSDLAPSALAGHKLRHPIVVVGGWAATVADKDGIKNEATISKTSASAETENSTGSVDQIDTQAPVAVTTTSQNGSPTSNTFPEQGTTLATRSAPVRVMSNPAQNSTVASRFIPGHQLASLYATASQQTEAAAQAPSPLQNSGNKSADIVHSNPSLPAARKKAEKSPDHLQFNVNEDVVRSLARVRKKTNAVITTSSLPDRVGYQNQSHQRKVMLLAVILTLTLLLFSTAVVAIGWRPSFPLGLPRQERKPVLSVDDLEHLIKNRSAEVDAAVVPVRGHCSPKINAVAKNIEPSAQHAVTATDATSISDGGTHSEAIGNEHEASKRAVADADSARPMGDQSVPPVAVQSKDRISSVHHLEPSSIHVPGRAQQSASKFNVDTLGASMLRRVSYGAAGLVVVGGPHEASSEAILAKVDGARQAEFLERRVILDTSQAQAVGVLNLFAVGSGSNNDLLAASHRFNAVFELHSAIFKSIFGARFVYDQKVMLRNLVMVLQAMPGSSLKTLYTILESPRSLEPLHDALADINSVSTRLFFTTVFSSDEFTDKAEFMCARLAPVIENELVAHLCCGWPMSDPIQELSSDGRWILLALDPDKVMPVQKAVLVRCLLSVLAMQNGAMGADSTSEITTTVFAPNLNNEIGGSASDIDFLLGQVKRAGYNVL